MKLERSCGAVVFTRAGKEFRYVIVREKSGFHSFPKGHMEGEETERETAVREITEETGLTVSFLDGFKAVDQHTMREKPGFMKQVTYFLAEYANQSPQSLEAFRSEIRELRVCSFSEAYHLFEFESARKILTKANNWLMMTDRIRAAVPEDREEILALYRAQIGREFCPWDGDYPGMEEIDRDTGSGSLFVLKDSGRIIAAISRERDADCDALPCWDPALQPAGEFSRVAVAPDMQGRGIARIMVSFMLRRLRTEGCRSVHILVNKHNLPALRAYDAFGFRTAGECEMYDQPFLCFEKAL